MWQILFLIYLDCSAAFAFCCFFTNIPDSLPRIVVVVVVVVIQQFFDWKGLCWMLFLSDHDRRHPDPNLGCWTPAKWLSLSIQGRHKSFDASMSWKFMKMSLIKYVV